MDFPKTFKNPKTITLCHFWTLLVIFAKERFFRKNRALSRTFPYGPLTPYKVSEKTNEAILRKLPERRTEGRREGQTQGQTLIHRNLPGTAGDPTIKLIFNKLCCKKKIKDTGCWLLLVNLAKSIKTWLVLYYW